MHGWTFFFLILVVMILFIRMNNLYGSAMCMQCGGRGKHKDECPWK